MVSVSLCYFHYLAWTWLANKIAGWARRKLLPTRICSKLMEVSPFKSFLSTATLSGIVQEKSDAYNLFKFARPFWCYMFRSRYYTISHLGILFELSLMRVLEEVSKKGDPLLFSQNWISCFSKWKMKLYSRSRIVKQTVRQAAMKKDNAG